MHRGRALAALYFPWAAASSARSAPQLAGVFKGQRPGSKGGGLFATIEGLLLIALIAAAASGTLWFLERGSDAAVLWRGHHIVAARAFAVLMGLHVLAVALRLVALVRD